MALLLSQIQEILKNPSKKFVIQKAVRHQNRLKFHTESYLDQLAIQQPVTEFLEWIRTLLPKDKFNSFVQLFRYPTPIIEFTSRIFGELEKVFDSRNASTLFQFKDNKLNDDWEWYRREKLKEPKIWKKKGWKKMKTSINSVLIIDLPEEQTTDLPEPYFYWLPIEQVIDFCTEHGKIEWIVFHQEEKIACFDDEFYRTFEVSDKNEIIEMIKPNLTVSFNGLLLFDKITSELNLNNLWNE